MPAPKPRPQVFASSSGGGTLSMADMLKAYTNSSTVASNQKKLATLESTVNLPTARAIIDVTKQIQQISSFDVNAGNSKISTTSVKATYGKEHTLSVSQQEAHDAIGTEKMISKQANDDDVDECSQESRITGVKRTASFAGLDSNHE